LLNLDGEHGKTSAEHFRQISAMLYDAENPGGSDQDYLLSIAQGTDILIDTFADAPIKLGEGLIRFGEAVRAFDAQNKK
jgi:hypothetical protein